MGTSIFGSNPGLLTPRNVDDNFYNGGLHHGPGDSLPKFYLLPKAGKGISSSYSKLLAFLLQTFSQENSDQTFFQNVTNELLYTAFFDFVLQSKNESYSEAKQEVKMIDGTIIRKYFNSNPKILNINGILLNTLNDDWMTKFSFYYDHILRGTILSYLDLYVVFDFVDKQYYGVFDSFQCNLDAQSQHYGTFAVSLSIEKVKYKILSTPGSSKFSSTTSNAPVWVRKYNDLLEKNVSINDDTVNEIRNVQSIDYTSSSKSGSVSKPPGDAAGRAQNALNQHSSIIGFA